MKHGAVGFRSFGDDTTSARSIASGPCSRHDARGKKMGSEDGKKEEEEGQKNNHRSK